MHSRRPIHSTWRSGGRATALYEVVDLPDRVQSQLRFRLKKRQPRSSRNPIKIKIRFSNQFSRSSRSSSRRNPMSPRSQIQHQLRIQASRLQDSQGFQDSLGFQDNLRIRHSNPSSPGSLRCSSHRG